MSKEMIISVNGREKKIAIIDNGKVTEFYIERGGEENSGVVGNIYKGRVQRVLPGMQSAFVEIGLERDAFLYVSDFFDEEEEIERIMMEKGKKGSPEEAKREADEKIERVRLERERQMEDVQEIAEPLVESGIRLIDEDEVEDLDEIMPVGDFIEDFTEVQAGEAEDAEEKQTGETAEQKKQRKNRRERKREKRLAEQQSQQEGAGETAFTETFQEMPAAFEPEDSSFERVVDDEDTGEMFKDAYRQEAIVDKVRAVEFDMESTATAEVGSLIDEVGGAAAGFERIADEEETETSAAQPRQSKSRRGKSGGKGKSKAAEKAAESVAPSETAAVEQAPEAVGLEEPQTEPKGRKKSFSRGKRGSSPTMEAAPAAEVKEPEFVTEVQEEAAAAGQEKPRSTGK